MSTQLHCINTALYCLNKVFIIVAVKLINNTIPDYKIVTKNLLSFLSR